MVHLLQSDQWQGHDQTRGITPVRPISICYTKVTFNCTKSFRFLVFQSFNPTLVGLILVFDPSRTSHRAYLSLSRWAHLFSAMSLPSSSFCCRVIVLIIIAIVLVVPIIGVLQRWGIVKKTTCHLSPTHPWAMAAKRGGHRKTTPVPSPMMASCLSSNPCLERSDGLERKGLHCVLGLASFPASQLTKKSRRWSGAWSLKWRYNKLREDEDF